MEYKNLIIFFFVIGYVQCLSYNHNYCTDLSSFDDIKLDEITGIWFGVEKIPHVSGEFKVEVTDECFQINITENLMQPNTHGSSFGLGEQYRSRHFTLEWHEGTQQSDYHVKVNTSKKGFWPLSVTDSYANKMHGVFGGIIQVLKATDKYLVLNFCLRFPHAELFSVVLARDQKLLSVEDLDDIHNTFTMRNLPTSTLKRVCMNSALNLNLPNIFLLIIILASTLITWRSQ